MLQQVFFYIFSVLAILSAIGVVLVKKPTRALLCLFITMISLAVLFTLLNAYFVAMVHLIVYAGAVLVLFLFVIMLQGLGAETPSIGARFNKIYSVLSVITGIAFVMLLIKSIHAYNFPEFAKASGTIENVGTLLFHGYLLPFELISFLILLGIFAAISLAKDDIRTKEGTSA